MCVCVCVYVCVCVCVWLGKIIPAFARSYLVKFHFK